MSMTLYSSDTMVEVLPIRMSWTMQSDASTSVAQRNAWFQAKHPRQDSMTVTFRNGPQEVQEQTAMCFQRWQRGNAILTLSWPEQHMNYKVTIASFSWQETAGAPTKDLTASFLLLTNMFQTSMTDMIVSTDVIKIVESMLENESIDDKLGGIAKDNNKNLYDKWSKENKQIAGMTIAYLGDGNVRISCTKPIDYTKPLSSSMQSASFTVPFSQDLAETLASNSDVYSYLQHLSGK